MLRNGVSRLGFRLLITAKALWAPTALGVVGAIFDTTGRVLLVRHGYMAGWGLPAGGVDRGETPDIAVLREMREEVGLDGGTAQFVALYTRNAGWATNVNLLYRITGGAVNFRPNWEIRDIVWADPLAPPPGTSPGTLRRLAELVGAPLSDRW